MGIVKIWFKIRCNRWAYAAVAAGLIGLFYCGPSWSYGSRLHHESVSILVPDHIEASLPGCKFLSKKGKKWEDLSPKEKEKLRKKYKEWQSLSPEEKDEMRQRMKRLKRMSPEERKTYRQLYKKWRHLPPDERQQLQKELDNWENLSPQQQEAIRRRFMK
jgi:hypothetical protein